MGIGLPPLLACVAASSASCRLVPRMVNRQGTRVARIFLAAAAAHGVVVCWASVELVPLGFSQEAGKVFLECQPTASRSGPGVFRPPNGTIHQVRTMPRYAPN